MNISQNLIENGLIENVTLFGNKKTVLILMDSHFQYAFETNQDLAISFINM